MQVDMLYVSMEVNGHKIKAFIDSGAQVTLTVTLTFALTRCNVTHIPDYRTLCMGCHRRSTGIVNSPVSRFILSPASAALQLSPLQICRTLTRKCILDDALPAASSGNAQLRLLLRPAAQMTIMGAKTAERLGLMRLIDRRFAGVAKGVGTGKILGRVHTVSVKYSTRPRCRPARVPDMHSTSFAVVKRLFGLWSAVVRI